MPRLPARLLVTAFWAASLGPAAMPARASASPPARAPLPAWKQDVVYQVFTRTFRDHDGDGVGDLAGVVEKVPYLQALGVDVVWLNPIYPSGGVDGGYDVSDFGAIDPAFGTMDDFDALRDALHARGMKLMMDLVLNHTSDRHPWFAAELGRKALQHQLADLVGIARDGEAEAILGLVADPDSAAEATGELVAVAKGAIATYLERDDRAAEAAGYPSHPASLQAIASHLRGCLGRGGGCRRTPMPFDDFYLWLDKPNNWHSVFGGSAWRPEPRAGGFVMHFFSHGQLDLNWRNPRVREAMGQVARTWQARGVDGFRLDSIITLAKDPLFLSDTSQSNCPGLSFFTNLPQIHRYIRHFTAALGPQSVTVGEASFSEEDEALRFASTDAHELNEIFLFDHVSLDGDHDKYRQIPLDVHRLKQVLISQQKHIHGRAWLGNYLENHDQLRVVDRFGDATRYPVASARALATLLMTLEGTPFIYQGQELGMTNLPAHSFARVEDIDDVEARGWYHDHLGQGQEPAALLATVGARCRDNVRTAMQWSGGAGAGFSAGRSRVRVNPNASWLNAEAEMKDPDSTWSTYRRLIALRRGAPEWVSGDFTDLAPAHPKVFAYRRQLAGDSSWVVINLSSQTQEVTLPAAMLPASPRAPVTANLASPPALAGTMTLPPWLAAVWRQPAASR